MISQSDKYYDDLVKQSQDWADKQTELQNQQTDLAIKEINQQKEQAKKDYIKDQSGAYADWQKQSNQYGANSEEIAAGGLANTGFAESSQVSMYNTYQNRVATAREAFVLAKQNYDNDIAEARLQNSTILAEIAAEAYEKQLQLALEGFQYKNNLILEQANKKLEVENTYYQRYQDVLAQINHENALAEEVRQYNESLAEEKRQHNASIAIQKAQLQLERDKFDWSKKQATQKTTSGTKTSRTTKNRGPKGQENIARVDGATRGSSQVSNSKVTYSDVAMNAAQLRKKGASKAEILQYLNTAVHASDYKATSSVAQDWKELISGYVGHSGR
jgi:hypothetical protein